MGKYFPHKLYLFTYPFASLIAGKLFSSIANPIGPIFGLIMVIVLYDKLLSSKVIKDKKVRTEFLARIAFYTFLFFFILIKLTGFSDFEDIGILNLFFAVAIYTYSKIRKGKLSQTNH